MKDPALQERRALVGGTVGDATSNCPGLLQLLCWGSWVTSKWFHRRLLGLKWWKWQWTDFHVGETRVKVLFPWWTQTGILTGYKKCLWIRPTPLNLKDAYWVLCDLPHRTINKIYNIQVVCLLNYMLQAISENSEVHPTTISLLILIIMSP